MPRPWEISRDEAEYLVDILENGERIEVVQKSLNIAHRLSMELRELFCMSPFIPERDADGERTGHIKISACPPSSPEADSETKS